LRDVVAEAAARPFRSLSNRFKSRNGNSSSDLNLHSATSTGPPGASSTSTRDLNSSRQTREDFWALKDVSFEVKKGEVLGIIGRNGAGKSTLLKILSRITEPTEGRIKIKGRVASLLEVGTGFHPELTGRENIYLNGAILGMHRSEIKTRFDEIVTFAEVEKFLDTPVKRYSSGMYVRLAFAVAAHLEPETLIIDEVLAVADAEFQRKCLGKMKDVAEGGRTVLFVSHNMDAITTLCSNAMVLTAGKNSILASPDEAVRTYLATTAEAPDSDLRDRPRFQLLPRSPIIQGLRIESGLSTHAVPTGASVTFEIDLRDFADLTACECGIIICDHLGQRMVAFHTYFHSGLTITEEIRLGFRAVFLRFHWS
jgi:lipopolysaccharide transport system ATP-binding protein